MHPSLLLVFVTILIALSFDFLNGFHDAANSIATVVSTRVLSPRLAVVWAATFNFIAAFIFGTAVANTISGGLVDPAQVTQYVILCALGGAIIWDILTWWWGLPTSSSHALIGGLAGAGIARAGWQVLIRQPKLHWPLIGTIPGLGGRLDVNSHLYCARACHRGVIGLILMIAVSWIFHRSAPRTVDKLFRKLQLLSAAAYSLGHGGSDAQKTMGIIAGALLAAGYLTPSQFAHGWAHTSGGSFWARTPPWDWAHISEDGVSFTPWAQKSPSSSPWVDFVLNLRAQPHCFFSPIMGFL